ncbi:MAG: tRNA pseudouridine(55) synthase TruB, partial [Acidobacteriota bacterium]|nr:tRNA pseudouridine(55) synthase TruB [Acidobacteriota bacterium]
MRHGLLLVDKEPGCTSHDVVQQARRLVRQKKIGHCGTLDPAATGLLVLTLGKATRLTRFLINAPKVYSGTIRFGIATDTYDAAGEVVSENPTHSLTQEVVEATMAGIVGELDQAAPPFSAKKIKGVKYYELARRGEPVPESRKRISIFDFAPTGDLEEDRIGFRLSCSSGTYVRSLAHDLGRQLGPGAHLESLRRLQVGPFDISESVQIEDLAHQLEGGDEIAAGWVPFDSIPLPFFQLLADAQQERRLVNGQTVLVRETACEEGDWIKIVNQRQQLIAVGSVIERIGQGAVGVIRPRIVF